MPASINLYHFGNPLYSIRFCLRCRKSFPQFIERFPVKQTAFLQFFHL